MTAEQAFQIVLRIVHITSGVLWVGAVWFFAGWVIPTGRAIGPQAVPFLQQVFARRYLQIAFAAATLNVVAGLILYWRASGGLAPGWFASATGVGFTVGGGTALAAWVIFALVIYPATARLSSGYSATVAGHPPQADDLARFQSARAIAQRATRLNAVLLAIGVLMMAAARYL